MLQINEFDFSQKTVLVTGAASGIGAAIAAAFAAHGATLKLADRDTRGLDARRASLTGASVATHVYDQRQPAQVEALAEWAGDVDVLINNAGVIEYGPAENLSTEATLAVLETNLFGPIVLANAVGRRMLARGRGVIVNTTSQLAFCGAPERAVYASAKAGLAQYTRSTAAEWGPRGVRVCAIAPGRTLTPLNAAVLSDAAAKEQGLAQIPLRRYGNVEEMAKLVLILASDVAAYVAGHSLIADGGYVVAQ